eukprot:scaffold11212_cov28-Tisochrysis_lutea.AAC.2
MQPLQPDEYLTHEDDEHVLGELAKRLEERGERAILNVLEHEVEVIGSADGFVEADNLRVLEPVKQLHLPLHRLGGGIGDADERNFLYRDYLPRHLVERPIDLAGGAASELLSEHIFTVEQSRLASLSTRPARAPEPEPAPGEASREGLRVPVTVVAASDRGVAEPDGAIPNPRSPFLLTHTHTHTHTHPRTRGESRTGGRGREPATPSSSARLSLSLLPRLPPLLRPLSLSSPLSLPSPLMVSDRGGVFFSLRFLDSVSSCATEEEAAATRTPYDR